MADDFFIADKATNPGFKFIPDSKPAPTPSFIQPALQNDLEGVSQPFTSSPQPQPFSEPVERGLEAGYKYGVAPFNKAQEAVAKQLRNVFMEEVANPSSNIPGGPQLFEDEGPTSQGFKTEGFSQVPIGIAGGIGSTIGGVVGDPRNWPFMAKGALNPIFDKLVSAGFATQMTHGTYVNSKELIDNWDKMTPGERAEGLTSTGLGALMTGLAVHGTLAREHLASDELDFLNKLVEDNINNMPLDQQASTRAEMKAVLDEFRRVADAQQSSTGKLQQVQKNAPSVEGQPVRDSDASSNEGATPPSTQEGRIQTLRDDTGTTGREGAARADSIERTEQERAGREASERELGTESILDMENRLRGVPVTEDNIASIQAILPEFNKLIGGGEGEGAHPSNREETGAYPATEDEPPLPVISRAVDDDLASSGINVVHRGRDINVISRFLGSFNETSRKLNEEGHPLGPVLKSMAGIISDVTKNIASAQTDTVKDFINGARKFISRDEWSGPVVDLMRRQVDERPPNTPDNIWQAYQTARRIDEAHRVKSINTKRQELLLNGFTQEQAEQWYPDTWGKKGEHYPELYPGTWAITRLAGVDEHGVESWEPIDHEGISWRAESRFKANKQAEAYLREHQGEQLRIRQDTVSLPGTGITNRARLIDINNKIKEATTTYIDGGADPKDILNQLYDQSGAAAYGPRNPAKRQFGPTMRREANLAGFSRDIDDFQDYLMAGERYFQLAPARQMLMKARNQIAQIAGMPQVQKVGEFPALSKYFSAAQYGNILARVDSAIEGLEGHPGAWDAGARYIASGMGFDPDIIAKMSRPIQQVVALMKLGFQPARILSHGMQTLWAVYPVLGEVNTLRGIAHAFDPHYDHVIHDLAVTHSGNMSDIEGLREYAGAYFGRGATPLDMTKGVAHIIRDLGLLPFTMGIDFTRRVAAVGGFLEGIDRGMLPEYAKVYAREVMDRTTGMYNAADNATFLRQLPGPVSQFKGFMFKTMQFMANLRGAELARFGAIISLMGVVGFPAIKALSNMIEQATGDNLENDLKRKFPVASRGVFGALGVDQPSAVGFADWFASRPGIPLGGIAGPAGSDALNFAKAGLERFKGPSRQADQDLDQAIRQLSPEGRRVWDEAIRGTRLPEPGLIDPRTGASILHQLTPLERLEAVAGFTPLRVAEERESHEYIRNQLMQAKDQRGFFVDKLAENQIELMRPGLTSNQKADLLKEALDLQKLAAEYNQAHNLVPAVRDRIKGMMQERLSRDIRKAPKVERPMIQMEIQRYQNQQER